MSATFSEGASLGGLTSGALPLGFNARLAVNGIIGQLASPVYHWEKPESGAQGYMAVDLVCLNPFIDGIDHRISQPAK